MCWCHDVINTFSAKTRDIDHHCHFVDIDGILSGCVDEHEGTEHPHQAQKPVALGHGEYPRWEGQPKPAPTPAVGGKPAARKGASGPRARTKRTAAEATRPSRTRRAAAGSKAAGTTRGEKA